MKNEQIKPVFPSKGRFRWVSKECRLFVKLEKEHLLFRYPRNPLLKREIICIAAFTDGEGFGLMVVGDSLSINASHFRPEDYDNGEFDLAYVSATNNIRTKKQQRHTIDMVPRDLVNLHIDFKQMGLGGEDSWGSKPLPYHELPAKQYSYEFTLKPIMPNQNLIELSKRR